MKHTDMLLTALEYTKHTTPQGILDSIAGIYVDFIHKQTVDVDNNPILTIRISPTFTQRVVVYSGIHKVAIETDYATDIEYEPPPRIRHNQLVNMVEARIEVSSILSDDSIRLLDQTVLLLGAPAP